MEAGRRAARRRVVPPTLRISDPRQLTGDLPTREIERRILEALHQSRREGRFRVDPQAQRPGFDPFPE